MSGKYRPGSFWTPERDVVLRRMWLADEHSAEEIALTIGAASRNAVISRAHRIGLPGKAGKARGRGKGKSLGIHPRNLVDRIAHKGKSKTFVFQTSPNMVRTPDLAPLPLPMPTADDVARVSFLDLETEHCRWPVLAEPAGPTVKQFCGLKRTPGASYCPGHHARATVPVRPRPPAVAAPVIEKQLEAA
jgi:hypothetical protein